MIKANKDLHKCYEKISWELKHVTNSFIRMLILFSLYEGDKTMKEIKEDTKLTYSAISTNMRILEVEFYVTREENRYFLSNVMRLYLKNLREFNKTIHILKEFYNIFENHKVRMLPVESIYDLHMIKNSQLIESCEFDVHKVKEIIVEAIKNSDEIKAILPVSFSELTQAIEDFTQTGKKAELKISYDIFDDVTKNIDLNLPNIAVKEFEKDFNFLVIINNNLMILGFYKKNGAYDQNRILLSNSKKGLKWADRLFLSI